MKFRSLKEIEALHHKYAPNELAFEQVFTHCTILCEIVEQLLSAQPQKLDAELVRIGCMLHDIGVYKLYGPDGKLQKNAHYITHGIRGEEILKAEGLSEELCRFASHHTGVGLKQDEIVRQKLPLPPMDYMAETAEERLVMYADKFHSKTEPPYFNSYKWYRRHVAEFGAAKVVAFDALAVEFGKPDLYALSQKYGYAIR